jgi:hypothetical protein
MGGLAEDAGRVDRRSRRQQAERDQTKLHRRNLLGPLYRWAKSVPSRSPEVGKLRHRKILPERPANIGISLRAWILTSTHKLCDGARAELDEKKI